MAEDNINKILKNYKNMSMEQLGSALMARQATNRSKAQKRYDHDERINKILAVLLGGQAIFKENTKNKLKDLNSLETELKFTQRDTVSKAKIIAQLGKVIPEHIIKAEDPYQAYLDDPSVQRNFAAIVAPILTPRFEISDKAGVAGSRLGGDLEQRVNSVAHAVTAKHFLTRTDSLKIGKESKSPIEYVLAKGAEFAQSNDKDKIFSVLLGLSEGQYQKNISKRKRDVIDDIDGRSRWTGVFGMVGDMLNPEAKSTFRKQNDPAVLDAGLSSFLEEIEIGEGISPNYDAVLEHWYSTQNFQTIAQGNAALRETDAGSRIAVATESRLREIRNSAANFNAKSQVKDPEVFNYIMKTQYFEPLNELDAVNRAFFGTEDEQLIEQGKGSREGYVNAFSTVRVAMDMSRQYQDLIDENYVSVIEEYTPVGTVPSIRNLDVLAKDKLAVHIALAEAMDVAHSSYELTNAPSFDRSAISAGTLKLYPNTKKIYGHKRPGGSGGFWYNTEPGSVDLGSNFRFGIDSSTSKIMASLMPPITGVSSNGEVELSEPMMKLMEDMGDSRAQEKNHYAFSAILNNALNDFSTKGHSEMTEQVAANILDKFPHYKAIATKEYGSIAGYYDALRGGELATPKRYAGFDSDPTDTSDTSGVPVPVSPHTGMFKGQQGFQISNDPAISAMWKDMSGIQKIQAQGTIPVLAHPLRSQGGSDAYTEDNYLQFVERIKSANEINAAKTKERSLLTPEQKYGPFDEDI
jgi:hypothetical protein